MSRFADTLQQQSNTLNPTNKAVLSLSRGGYHGFAPSFADWESNQPYTQQQLYTVLLQAPTAFNMLPDGELYRRALKTMIELKAKRVEGFNQTLSVTKEGVPIGGSQEIHEVNTKVERTRTNPVLTFDELYGRPIQNFLYKYITYFGMDPETQHANIVTFGNARPTDLLPDQTTFSMLAFEPDPTFRYIDKAWVVYNCFPNGTGDIVGRKDKQSPNNMLELTVEMGGFAQVGRGVDAFAQQILERVNLENANPYLRPAAISAISSDVAAANAGFMEQIAELSRTAIRP